MCRATIYDARNNFSSLVKIAEGGEPVELTRHDKPVAVIISYEEFQARKPKESFIDKLEKLKKKYADIAQSDEDVLSIALFGDVAIKYITQRNEDRKPKKIKVSV